ncbi:MAG TPA: ribose-phosphate pyrophosphokinase [Cellulomonas sp.]|uniref:ribose-phosphate diphosphokinase n=1 Tax=Cellulomonas sp. TaxID=40001 RepID=UPI002E32FC55|nr:ribose-phosphate pyrophosphokinase [Cellulomonas sp.]HEX5333912.1 ribose-phosphate pyrophosphokinase [Cellulomonas sp.]
MSQHTERVGDTLRLVAGSANPALARAIATELGTECVPAKLERFPDGELRPTLGRVRGADVFVIQPTGPPVSDNLVELLLLIDACRRGGAERVTAVVPYFCYARQDRRGRAGDAVGAKVVADVIVAAGADRLVVVDPHTAALEAMFAIPVEMLTAVPILAEAVRPALPADAVVVAPDLGATKLAERFASLLNAPVAVVRKTRVSGSAVRAEELVGDVAGRAAVIVDDMISTGGTIEAALRVVAAHGASPDVMVAATHGLFVGPAGRRLESSHLRRLFVTDSTVLSDGLGLPIHVRSIAALLADAVWRLHRNEPLDDLLIRT